MSTHAAIRLALGLTAFWLALPAAAICPAGPDCDPNVDTYLVRQSCAGLSDCFESMEALVGRWNAQSVPYDTEGAAPPADCTGGVDCELGWLWGGTVAGAPTRTPPSAASPVTVDVGPGSFGSFICPDAAVKNGWVTLKGAGEATVLSGFVTGHHTGIDVNHCEALVVEDLIAFGSVYGVRWVNGGSGTWRGALIVSWGSATNPIAWAWVDDLIPGPVDPYQPDFLTALAANDRSIQLLSGCRVVALGVPGSLVRGYFSRWSVTTFVDGSIEALPGSSNGQVFSSTEGLRAENGSRFWIHGTEILVKRAAAEFQTIFGVHALGAGTEIHLINSDLTMEVFSPAVDFQADPPAELELLETTSVIN